MKPQTNGLINRLSWLWNNFARIFYTNRVSSFNSWYSKGNQQSNNISWIMNIGSKLILKLCTLISDTSFSHWPFSYNASPESFSFRSGQTKIMIYVLPIVFFSRRNTFLRHFRKHIFPPLKSWIDSSDDRNVNVTIA